MRCASKKRLMAELNLDAGQAAAIRTLCAVVDQPEALETLIDASHPETARYVASMHSSPYRSAGWRRTVVLFAIDKVLGTCGVEHLGPVDMRDGPPYLYCNTGDTYAATLVYTRDTDTLRVGSWGDIAERHGARWE